MLRFDKINLNLVPYILINWNFLCSGCEEKASFDKFVFFVKQEYSN